MFRVPRSTPPRLATFAVAFVVAASSFAYADDMTGKQVLEKAIDAMGGRAAMEKVKSRITTVTAAVPAMNVNGTVTIYQQAPNKAYIVQDIAGIGKTESGTDGNIAWQMSPMMGVRILSGEEKEATMREATLNSDLEPDKWYKSIENTGTEDVNGKPAYKVVFTTNSGQKETRYFDKASFLPVKTETVVKGPQGEVPVSTLVTDWQEIEGIKMPMKVTQHIMQFDQTLTVTKVEQNVDIPAEKFEVPEKVKAAASKPAASRPAQGSGGPPGAVGD